MKKRFLLIILLFLLPLLLNAAGVADFTKFVTETQNLFLSKIAGWGTTINPIAQNLFFSLAIIQIVLIGIKLIFGNVEMNKIFEELVLFILVGGFIMWLITAPYSKAVTSSYGSITVNANVLMYIQESLAQLGNTLVTAIIGGPPSSTVGGSIDGLGGILNNFFKKLSEEIAEFDDIEDYIVLLVVGLASTVAITRALTAVLKNYIFVWIAIFISPLIFAVGILEYTRSWILSIFMLVIKYSLKYMTLLMIIGLSLGLLNDAVKATIAAKDSSILSILIISFLMFELVDGVEGIIEGMFSGAHHSSGAAATFRAASTAAKTTTKTASVATKSAAAVATGGAIIATEAAKSSVSKAASGYKEGTAKAQEISSNSQSTRSKILKGALGIRYAASGAAKGAVGGAFKTSKDMAKGAIVNRSKEALKSASHASIGKIATKNLQTLGGEVSKGASSIKKGSERFDKWGQGKMNKYAENKAKMKNTNTNSSFKK